MAFAVVCLVGACAAPAPSIEPNDPDEEKDREVHAFNKALDQAIVKPTAGAYGDIVPDPIEIGVSNFARNVELPGHVVNGALQLRPHHVLENTLRFAINTTVGIGGLFDPASAIGLPGKETDFGETLHVWGVGEGSYMELPILGPSTGRDAMGTIVDIALNPLGRVLPSPESHFVTLANVASKLGDRNRYSETIDSVLYDSADSYAQTRLLYLQNRRFELGQTEAADDSFIDPYEE